MKETIAREKNTSSADVPIVDFRVGDTTQQMEEESDSVRHRRVDLQLTSRIQPSMSAFKLCLQLEATSHYPLA